MDLSQALGLSPLILMVAFLYASVGHGGASGYLAVMSLATFIPQEMATTALLLNLLVAGLATLAYWRAGHLAFRLPLSFAITSVPAAFVGGRLHISPAIYGFLLTVVLVFAAARLLFSAPSSLQTRRMPRGSAPLLGAGIGLLSGIVGVGGGIFLSPLLLLFRWADTKQTAAASAIFILVNSLSGLLGRYSAGVLDPGPFLLLLAPAVLGGILGSELGARRFSGLTLRRVLALALLVAAGKLVLTVL
ncbi:MAG: sulfite exporter TauE/SafE family protein [Chloroflexi bacterium]|nr:sulfite exporter TauE/SafE family protein [Chloroflexota bacterium]